MFSHLWSYTVTLNQVKSHDCSCLVSDKRSNPIVGLGSWGRTRINSPFNSASSPLSDQYFSHDDTSLRVAASVQIAEASGPCLQGLLPPYHTSIHQESRSERKPLCKHSRSLPLLPVFCSFFPLFPLGGTLTSFVRTITPLTLGIKTWNLCGLIRFRAEFILSPWKAKRERGKRRIWAAGSIMNFSVCPDRYIKNKCWVLITFKSSNRTGLSLLTGLSISMGSSSNTNCQITASIIESYTSVLTSNWDFVSVETTLTRQA